MLKLDHLVVTAARLEDGVAVVEQALGVPLSPGGQHSEMGTHNCLLKLGQGLYLEVMAVDPAAPPPDRPRWFGLDQAPGHVRLSHWVVRTDGLEKTCARSSLALGEPADFQRGDYRWRMALPQDGSPAYDGAVPALLEWQGEAHPAEALPDAGCRLLRLTVSHPKIEALRSAMPALARLPKVRLEPGPFEIAARIETPTGQWTLA